MAYVTRVFFSRTQGGKRNGMSQGTGVIWKYEGEEGFRKYTKYILALWCDKGEEEYDTNSRL